MNLVLGQISGDIIMEKVSQVKIKLHMSIQQLFQKNQFEDHINSWTNIGDIVFDPFGGSGTTAKVSMQLKRRWIYIEKVEKYCTIAKKRIATIDQIQIIKQLL